MTIIDVSNVIYGGHLGRDYRVKGFPVGGIRKLLGIVNATLGRSDMIFAFDSGNLVKKELYPEYKSGRVPDYSVWAQIDYLKEIFDDCNIPYYQMDRYEADDIITSVCALLQDIRYPEDVVVYSDDHDLACVVSPTTVLKNVTSQGSVISHAVYKERVVPGSIVPYNTILLHKVVYGDSSDSYGRLPVVGLSFEELAKVFVDSADELIDSGQLTESVYSNYEAFELIFNEFKSQFTEQEQKLILDRARLVFPYRVKVLDDEDAFYREYPVVVQKYVPVQKHMQVLSVENINRQRFYDYCTVLGLNKTHYSRQSDKNSKEVQSIYDRLGVLASDLVSGVTAANHMGAAPHVVCSPELASMELPV